MGTIWGIPLGEYQFMDIIKKFKALSDPTRLRLLNMLSHYELNVNEIVSIVEMIQSGVSRHLKILLEAGLLVSRKDGSYIYYSDSRTEEASDLIQFVVNHLGTDSVFSNDLERAGQSISLRKNRTKRFFRTVAPQWDRLKKEVLGPLDLTRIICEQLGPCKTMADLGCGTGEILSCLVDLDKAKLIGVDASPEMLEQARIRLPQRAHLELRLGELENLPMRNQEVDAAVMSMVLYHVVEPEKSICEVARVLKHRGRFVLADFRHHNQEGIKEVIGGSWMGFKKEQIQEWLAENSLSLEDYTEFKVEKNLVIALYTAEKRTETQ